MSSEGTTIGILCGGGPAPGMNGVIAAATLAAVSSGYRVIGFLEGFKYISLGRSDQCMILTVDDVSRIHTKGGSILKTSRSNPTKKPEHLENCLRVFEELGVTKLITIGGDDTAFSASTLAFHAGNKLAVVHVPKTIDNDLPLPAGQPTFGFTTATEFGSEIISSLMEDSKTAPRWFLVEAMGRKAGHLALALGKTSGAHLTLIPEEFQNHNVTFKEVCDIVWGTVLKRESIGRPYGVIILAEGLVEFMSEQELEYLSKGQPLSRDPHGHIRLDEFEFTRLVREEVQKRASDAGLTCRFTDKKVGYELRCADPCSTDIQYTRDLGYHAFKFLHEGGSGGMVLGEQIMTFEDLRDPDTGKTRVRLVDIESNTYRVAREYMTRLEVSDLEDDDVMTKIGATIGLTLEEVRAYFEPSVRANAR